MTKRKSRSSPASSSANVANPLQRMFGTFLRLERKRLSLESKHMAITLGLAETYYRLVESGRATFNQGLSFKLIGILASHNALSGDLSSPDILFHRLAHYLVGSHCVGTEMARQNSSSTRVDLCAMQVLAEEDADFELFHQETKDYYNLKNDNEGQRRFLEITAAPAVAKFLTASTYVNPSNSEIVARVIPPKEFEALPTLSVEIVARLVADLTGRPFVHTPEVASTWENRQSRHIVSVEGIYRDSDLILEDDNLTYFQYPYLTEKHFSTLQFVFLKSTAASSTILKKNFVKKLNALRLNSDLPRITPEHAKRIEFVLLSEKAYKTYKPEIDKILARNSLSKPSGRKYKAYWSFDTSMGLPPSAKVIQHGFICDGESTSDIWNLDLVEAVEKRNDFQKLWRKINT